MPPKNPTPQNPIKNTAQISPQIIFGPVLSRRFGRSLGVDLSPSVKQCNFDCVYCELHKAKPVDSMSKVVPYTQILEAIKGGLQAHKDICVLTFTATGEPTLYPQLYELISATKPLLPPHIKTLILSNGSKFQAQKKALALFDIVKFSIDAAILGDFRKIDRPSKRLSLPSILRGIEDFSVDFRGELVAEVLLVEGHNDSEENLRSIAEFLRNIRISRVDLGSIDRPSAYQVKAVSEEKLRWASEFFAGLNLSLPKRVKIESKDALDTADISQVCPKDYPTKDYSKNKKTKSSNPKQSQNLPPNNHKNAKSYTKDSLLKFIATRPVERDEAELLFDKRTLKILDSLLEEKKITLKSQAQNTFYTIAKA